MEAISIPELEMEHWSWSPARIQQQQQMRTTAAYSEPPRRKQGPGFTNANPVASTGMIRKGAGRNAQ
eukprot:scaffold6569_cov79-Skeletonema_marinoi.AAC.2